MMLNVTLCETHGTKCKYQHDFHLYPDTFKSILCIWRSHIHTNNKEIHTLNFQGDLTQSNKKNKKHIMFYENLIR